MTYSTEENKFRPTTSTFSNWLVQLQRFAYFLLCYSMPQIPSDKWTIRKSSREKASAAVDQLTTKKFKVYLIVKAIYLKYKNVYFLTMDPVRNQYIKIYLQVAVSSPQSSVCPCHLIRPHRLVSLLSSQLMSGCQHYSRRELLNNKRSEKQAPYKLATTADNHIER